MNKVIEVKLEKVLAMNGKASQLIVPIYAPPGFLKEWERLEQKYFNKTNSNESRNDKM